MRLTRRSRSAGVADRATAVASPGLEHININALGFIIVAMFAATWIIALSVWRVGRIDERWNTRLVDSETST